MKFILLLFISFSLFFLTACKNKKEEQIVLDSKDLDSQMIEAYNSGVDALDKGDVLYAAKKFNEAELLFPQSEWAPKSSLMAAYGYWTQGYYSDSINELKRFLKLYPKNKNLDYAYYLLAMNYYDSIIDEKKDFRIDNLDLSMQELVSGILSSQQREIIKILNLNHLSVDNVSSKKDWVCIKATKKKQS